MRHDACPSDEVLSAFNLGDLDEPALEALGRHQEGCPRCEARARELEGRTDEVLDALRRSTLGSTAPGPSPRPIEAAGPWAWELAEHVRPVLPDYLLDDEPIGCGSMGVVYKARHLKLDRIVALKVIAGRSRRVSELFRSEARAVAQLQHPHIVQIFEIGDHGGQPYLALEYVEGGSLDRRLAGRPQPPRAAAELVLKLARAADYAHRHGIVHCDLKPSNILLTPDGEPKIADFGVARWLGSGGPRPAPQAVMGTPRYMAPEQASGQARAVGPASDVYSLGVILYEMLTGQPPYPSATSVDELERLRGEGPVPPRRLRPKLARDLETIVLKCLHPEPARRYADARALADDLARHLACETILARPAGRVERAYRLARRHPALVGALALATLWFVTFGTYHSRYHAMRRRFDADLRNATHPEPVTIYGKKSILVAQAADGSLRLNAFAAAVYGDSLALEPRFSNLGYWYLDNDRAVWTFRIDRPATFDVALEYADGNPVGVPVNSYRLSVDGTSLRGRVLGTGAWSDYRTLPAGELTLPTGVHRLEVRSEGKLRGALFDLRAVLLTPRAPR